MPTLKQRLLTVLVALAASASFLAAAAPAAAEPCAYASDAMNRCTKAAETTVQYVVCFEAPCFGVYGFVKAEEHDVRETLACVQRIPIGTHRCIDNYWQDNLGFHIDELASDAKVAFMGAQGWASPLPAYAPPDALGFGFGPTLAPIDVLVT